MKRRDFLAATVGTGLAGQVSRAEGRTKPIPKRRYKDGVDLSIVGFGGVVVMGQEQDQANRAVAQSVERGVNYFDVAPLYGDGEAEIKLGIALKPYRKDVFLACKTHEFDAAGSLRELERSLKRLHTDHFDLYQFHNVSSLEEVEKILGPNGAAETFVKAQQEGKVRYLGFSAHSAEAAVAMLDRFDKADSVLFPLNFVSVAQGNFGPQILEKAKEKGVARLALKALAHTPWPQGTKPADTNYPKCWYKPVDLADHAFVARALGFTLSEDITAAIPPGDERLYQLALDLAPELKPMDSAERGDLLASTSGVEPLFRA